MPNTEIMSRTEYTEADGSRSVSRMFHVDASSQTAALAIAESEFEAYVGAAYIDAQGNQSDPDLACTRVRARQLTPVPIGESGAWEVQADYQYETQNGIGQIPVPVNGLARYRVETRTEWQTTVRDRFGDLITNTAGDLFESGAPQKLVCDDILIVEFIRPYNNAIEAWAYTRPYLGRTNSVEYHGAPKHCIVLEGAEVQQLTAGAPPVLSKFLHTLRFRFKEQQDDVDPVDESTREVGGWDSVVLNLGRRVLTGDPLHPYRELRSGMELGESFGALNQNEFWDARTEAGRLYQARPLIDYPMFLKFDGSDVLISPDDTQKYVVVEPIREIDFNLLGV